MRFMEIARCDVNETRNEMIRMILDMFDALDASQMDNEMLRRRLDAYEKGIANGIVAITEMDEHVLKYGREQLVDKSLEYWHDVKYDKDDETGEVSVEPFSKWCSHAIRITKIPSWCSFDAFVDYFHIELRAIYDKECSNAVAEAHNER